MMMKSQGMIANESIFADERQELKHPDPDKVGAGAGRGERRGGRGPINSPLLGRRNFARKGAS